MNHDTLSNLIPLFLMNDYLSLALELTFLMNMNHDTLSNLIPLFLYLPLALGVTFLISIMI